MSEAAIPYEVRWAKTEEWAPAMKMIWKTFLKYEGEDYTEEGIRNFFEFITDDDLYVSFLKGDYQMMVALDKERVIGAASVRSCNHLSLLFVDEEYHRQGVGRTLMSRMCEYLKQEAGERYMSLNAAPYAVNFYRKLGFQAVRPEDVYAGIRVTSMEKVL
ncbi:MAG: GNAT family N-acetyltransferase [Lachnospiraceae bacterium]|nr:GNAT family N-acetyltransferase [Lachnospiraceae bacterium]